MIKNNLNELKEFETHTEIKCQWGMNFMSRELWWHYLIHNHNDNIATVFVDYVF